MKDMTKSQKRFLHGLENRFGTDHPATQEFKKQLQDMKNLKERQDRIIKKQSENPQYPQPEPCTWETDHPACEKAHYNKDNTTHSDSFKSKKK